MSVLDITLSFANSKWGSAALIADERGGTCDEEQGPCSTWVRCQRAAKRGGSGIRISDCIRTSDTNPQLALIEFASNAREPNRQSRCNSSALAVRPITTELSSRKMFSTNSLWSDRRPCWNEDRSVLQSPLGLIFAISDGRTSICFFPDNIRQYQGPRVVCPAHDP